jgi:hypothetical protein
MPRLSDVGPNVKAKLVNILGLEKAEHLVAEVLPELGLAGLRTADDRLRFGRALATRGGMLAVIGHSIQTQAILHGAISDLEAAMSSRSR